MANRRPTATPQPAQLTPDQIRRGISRLEKRIEDVEAFDPETISERWGYEATTLQTAINETLSTVFGINSVKYNLYKYAANLDHGTIIMNRRESVQEIRKYLYDGKLQSLALLRQAVRGLNEELQDHPDSHLDTLPTIKVSPDLSKVFVVHGHDGEVRESVARFISERLGLEPVILHERPNKGRTIITKFREEAVGAGFAVVLMTADDLGKAKDANELKPRSRQNVVFELGFFIGALGSERVAAIVKGDIERPSDFDGVVYISFDKEDWRTKLGKELQEAGYAIDWNTVMRP